MKIIDSHIHMDQVKLTDEELVENRKKYLGELAQAGVWGSQIMSPDPKKCAEMGFDYRLHAVMKFCEGQDNLFPFMWIHPKDYKVMDQIDKAAEAGIVGFKMICTDYYPGDPDCVNVCRKIASVNKPVLFHSGILWDGQNSAKYNRPGNFEALLEVPNLKFCLAHVSWPWTDECIAVYGKFNNAFGNRPELSCEMFIDITPGTPHVYREEVFKRLFCSDYQVKYNVMFGSDCNTAGYNIGWTKEWLEQDMELIRRFNPDDPEFVLEHVYEKNFMRFIGRSDETFEKIFPDVAV